MGRMPDPGEAENHQASQQQVYDGKAQKPDQVVGGGIGGGDVGDHHRAQNAGNADQRNSAVCFDRRGTEGGDLEVCGRGRVVGEIVKRRTGWRRSAGRSPGPWVRCLGMVLHETSLASVHRNDIFSLVIYHETAGVIMLKSSCRVRA